MLQNQKSPRLALFHNVLVSSQFCLIFQNANFFDFSSVLTNFGPIFSIAKMAKFSLKPISYNFEPKFLGLNQRKVRQ